MRASRDGPLSTPYGLLAIPFKRSLPRHLTPKRARLRARSSDGLSICQSASNSSAPDHTLLGSLHYASTIRRPPSADTLRAGTEQHDKVSPASTSKSWPGIVGDLATRQRHSACATRSGPAVEIRRKPNPLSAIATAIGCVCCPLGAFVEGSPNTRSKFAQELAENGR
jgi:hypothetical protein